MENKMTFTDYLANKLSKENKELRLENARLEFSILALKEQIAELTKESEDDLK